MGAHSSILAWRIPWTEEPGRLSPQHHKESDTTEQLTHIHTSPSSSFILWEVSKYPFQKSNCAVPEFPKAVFLIFIHPLGYPQCCRNKCVPCSGNTTPTFGVAATFCSLESLSHNIFQLIQPSQHFLNEVSVANTLWIT